MSRCAAASAYLSGWMLPAVVTGIASCQPLVALLPAWLAAAGRTAAACRAAWRLAEDALDIICTGICLEADSPALHVTMALLVISANVMD